MLKLRNLLKESKDYEIFAKNLVKKYGSNIPTDEKELINLIHKEWVANAVAARLPAPKAEERWRRLTSYDEDFLSDHISAIHDLQKGALALPEEKDLYHTPVKATVSKVELGKMWSWFEDMKRYAPVARDIDWIIANPNTFKTWDKFHDAVMDAFTKYEKLSKKKIPNDIEDIILRHIESELEYYG